MNDNPDESVSTRISDTEGSQKDAQTVEEEEQSLTLSGQDSEQNALEQDINQKKRRRKNQDESSEQEVNLSGNATVQPGSSKGENHKSKCITYVNSSYITCEDTYTNMMYKLTTFLLDSSN